MSRTRGVLEPMKTARALRPATPPGGEAVGTIEDAERTRLSRFLSYALRHAPGQVGISLDRHGWADVRAVLVARRDAGHTATRDAVLEVVRRCEKQRFEYDDVADRVRSVHGHSVEVELALEPRAPPPVLYHGTHRSALARVLAEGLRPMRRRHVHLSVDIPTATEVGRRRGEPAVLRVAAAEFHAAGGRFFVSASGVWLTEQVPPEYLQVV
jgi:putative RNA 2'-phosphotransferase